MGVSEMKEILNSAGLQASAARLAVANYVLHTDSHPTAEEIREEVEKQMPSVSLATIYNTLHLFVEKGLLITVKDPKSDRLRYDCNTKAHFHFYDEESGRMYDLDPQLLKVSPNFEAMQSKYEVRGIEVTLRGKKKKI